ncbi:MAG: hypothetical protein WBL67_20035 [Nitrososphaeraceae archaeon]
MPDDNPASRNNSYMGFKILNENVGGPPTTATAQTPHHDEELPGGRSHNIE